MSDPKNKVKTLKKTLFTQVEKSNNIVITGHLGPDGDAIASVLSMLWLLKKYYPNKNITVNIEGVKNNTWNFYPTSEQINWVNDFITSISQADLVIFLDGGELHRFTDNKEIHDFMKARTFTSFCIDHHPDYENEYFDFIYVDDNAAAVAQIITDKLYIDEDLTSFDPVEMLLYGILSDTGGLTFIGTYNSDVLITVKRLIDVGKIPQIDTLLIAFNSKTPEEFSVIKTLINNTVNYEFDDIPGLTYSYLERNDQIGTDYEHIKHAKDTYSEWILRRIKGHPWGFVVTAKGDGNFGISFRSDDKAPNVKNITRDNFEGGGHIMASGGVYKPVEGEIITAKEVAQKVIKVILNSDIEYISL